MGKLHYKITLDDSRVWERHADQILRSGEYWDQSEEPPAEAEPNVPEAREERVVPQANEEGRPQPEPEQAGPPLEEREAPAQGPAQHVERPARTRRPPKRYIDFVCDKK
ncbi:hypothetical protein RF55_10919 [Lasius niger]|uniref:Uncharacterized protein n=1 Tax=Lasius niger TaxID=67767 RepID=A0A0J7KGW1_LASNI|nr:hypothetical protein RF55_10919 [Lasius niger]